MTRLRFLTRVNPSKSEVRHLSPDTVVTFAPMEALADGMGGLDLSLSKPLGEVIDASYSYFAEGDLLLAKVTPCFENGKKAVALGLTNGIGFATSEVHVVRPDARKVERRYLNYLFCSEEFRAAAMATMTGTGGLRRISDRAILDFELPISNLVTQRAVADFLDRETGQIQQLIEKVAGMGAAIPSSNGNFLSLLTEKRGALITLAVRGQLAIA